MATPLEEALLWRRRFVNAAIAIIGRALIIWYVLVHLFERHRAPPFRRHNVVAQAARLNLVRRLNVILLSTLLCFINSARQRGTRVGGHARNKQA